MHCGPSIKRRKLMHCGPSIKRRRLMHYGASIRRSNKEKLIPCGTSIKRRKLTYCGASIKRRRLMHCGASIKRAKKLAGTRTVERVDRIFIAVCSGSEAELLISFAFSAEGYQLLRPPRDGHFTILRNFQTKLRKF